MPWFPEIAGLAFCETIELRRRIVERQQIPRSFWLEVLEPSNEEFIAALAAGINAHHILQIGCGISTIALAVAARATGSYLLSVNIDKEKQEIINDHVQYLGLVEYVKFITDEPRNVIPQHDGFDFAFISGDPECYIELFDLLSLNNEAIVVADNALDEALNEYIKHVHRQPGMHSSTLPLDRGIEVTKIVSWEEFKSGRVFCCEFGQEIDEFSGSYNYGNVILQDGFPTKYPIKLNCLFDDNLTNSAKGDAERNALEEGIISASSLQTVDGLEGAMDWRYFPEHHIEDPAVNKGQPESVPIENHGGIGFRVHFENEPLYTKITIEGPEQDMLLSAITMTFDEMGISVQQARISTEEKFIEDVFYVVKSKSGVPLDPCMWDTVRKRMLEQINARTLKG